jgi:hypothetical protein
MTSGEVLDAIARLGGFFDLTRVPAQARPLRALVDGPDVLADRVLATRRALAARAGVPVAAIEPRAAASTLHLGLAARIASPVLAAEVVHGAGLPLDLDRLRIDEADGALSLAADGAAPLPAEQVLSDVLVPLVDAFGRASVSRRVLWGNVAAAFAGAAGVLGALEPVTAPSGRAVVDRLLRRPRLDGTGAWTESGFRRASCCLYYRLPGGGLCGDCVLRRR